MHMPVNTVMVVLQFITYIRWAKNIYMKFISITFIRLGHFFALYARYASLTAICLLHAEPEKSVVLKKSCSRKGFFNKSAQFCMLCTFRNTWRAKEKNNRMMYTMRRVCVVYIIYIRGFEIIIILHCILHSAMFWARTRWGPSHEMQTIIKFNYTYFEYIYQTAAEIIICVLINRAIETESGRARNINDKQFNHLFRSHKLSRECASAHELFIFLLQWQHQLRLVSAPFLHNLPEMS